MKSWSQWAVSLLLGLLVPAGLMLAQPAKGSRTPALVLVVVIDGLGQDQLDRLLSQTGRGGFKRLSRGAWFSDARYGHASTFTASGHATILTGAFPNRHGVVGNEWTDPETGNRVYCVSDPEYPVLGSAGEWGVSPLHLKVPTLGDVLREFHSEKARVVSISIKDRGAVLPAGQAGKAFFYNASNGLFVSSSYYLKEYPKWWFDYYRSGRPQDRWFRRAWKLLRAPKDYAGSAPTGRDVHIDAARLGKAFPHVLGRGEMEPGPVYYSALTRTPFGNDYTLEFVKAAVQGERLGRNPDGKPDLLAVSLSSHDYVNHGFGPESLESHDAFLRLDRTLSDLLKFVDGTVGLKRTAVALTADHGFADSPEWLQARGEDAGRIDPEAMIRGLNEHLSESFGEGRWALSWFNPTVFLSHRIIRERGLQSVAVEAAAAEFLEGLPGVARVFTRRQLQSAEPNGDGLFEMALKSWKPDVSGDLFVIQKRGWFLLGDPAANCATHGSPYDYDTKVPMMLLGPWFRPGRYDQRVDVTDLAPTLAQVLGLQMPESSQGRVLSEVLASHAAVLQDAKPSGE